MSENLYEEYDVSVLNEKNQYYKSNNFDLMYINVLESIKSYHESRLFSTRNIIIPSFYAVKLKMSRKTVIDILNKAVKEGLIRGPLEVQKFHDSGTPTSYRIGILNGDRKHKDNVIINYDGTITNPTDSRLIPYGQVYDVKHDKYALVGWVKNGWYFVPNHYSYHVYYDIGLKTFRGQVKISKKEAEKRKRKYVNIIEKSSFDGIGYEILYDSTTEDNLISIYLSKLKEEKMKKQEKFYGRAKKSPIICELCEEEIKMASRNSKKKRKHPKRVCKLEQIKKIMEK